MQKLKRSMVCQLLPLVIFLSLLSTCVAQANSSTGTTAPPPTTTTGPTSSDRDAWVGEYSPGSCTSGLTCCCPTGNMQVTLGTDPLTIELDGSSEGGPSCAFQTTLGGTFTLTTPHDSYYVVSFISLTANATLSQNDNQLTITTTHTTCPVIFNRVVTGVSSSSSTGSGPSGGSLSPVDYDYAVQITAWASDDDPTVHDYTVAFAVPMTTPITNPKLLYSTGRLTTVQSVDMTQTLASTFTFTRLGLPASSLTVYTFSPVELYDDDVLSYSFTYNRNGNDFGTQGQTFQFQDDANVPSNPAAGNNMLVGTYSTLGGCVPSSACCCAVGNLSVVSSGLASNDVVISGQLDGGGGCYQQTSLGGIFHMDSTNALSAYNTFSAGGNSANFTAFLASTNPTAPTVLAPSYVATAGASMIQTLKADYSTLTITNSYFSCPSKAVRVADVNNDNPGGSFDLLTTVLGDWYPDGTCVASETCCCASGKTHITPSPTDTSSVMVATTLAGEGLSCMNTDGPIQLTFTAVNSTYAISSPMPLLTFAATLLDNNRLLYVSNTIHPTCPSQFVRTQSNGGLRSRSLSNANSLTLAGLAAFLVGLFIM